jgi:PAS domain S-box-containing protein
VGNITSLRDGIAKFQASEERLRGAFALAERAVQIGYWRYDLITCEHFWSPGMHALMGMDPSMPPGTGWLRSHLSVAEQVHVAEVIGEAMRSRAPFFYRVRDITLGPLRDNATNQILDAHGEVELDADGNVVALNGICQNVTRRQREEEASEIAQEQYRAMTREASDIIVFYTVKGDIIFASDALERLLGRTATEIERCRFLSIVHPDDAAEARKTFMIPTPGESLTATYRVLHSGGHYLWLEVVTRAIYDETTGKVRNIVSVSRDISARKAHELELEAAQARAEAANRAKSAFLANMSHELRTPLNAIIGFSEMMREKIFGPLGDAHYTEYTGLIHNSGRHLLDLITDMLDMAKIEAGKMVLTPERMELGEALDDCLHTLQAQATAARITLSSDMSGHPVLFADRRAVKQVLLNLLSNALKFTTPGGQVMVSAWKAQGHAYIAVRDTGIGIAEEDLKRLGNPFEQVKVNPMHAQGGTGLGLALVKALVEKHGGHCVVESELGIGTTVMVDFPLAPNAIAKAS